MSTTTTPSKGAAVNQIVKDAQDLPTLIQGLSTVEPALVAQLQGKALTSSTTPWVTLVATGVAWASTKYGLGWDETTDSVVTGAVLVIVAYILRMLGSVPITGIFGKKSVIASTAAAKALLILAATAALAGLTACASKAPPGPTAVAAIGEALTAADQVALTYVQLPACPAGAAVGAGGALCAQPAIKAQIKKAAATAYGAYKTAEANPNGTGLVTAAEQALLAYTAVIPPVK